MLTASERRLEVVSHNIANTGTAGYKAQISFSEAMASQGLNVERQMSSERATNFAQGRLSQTNSPLDFAISGNGLFKVRSGESMFYTRQGKFQMIEGGRLATPQGMILQAEDGGDIVLGTLAAQVEPDGTILEDGIPTSRIGLYAPISSEAMISLGGTMFSAPQAAMVEVSEAIIRQGMTEASNVTVAEQMTLMMSSIREAETGSKLVQTYDTLIGQAISTFGQGSR